MTDLKPCPFCGGEADYFVPTFIQCNKCGARSGYYDTYAAATAAWNTRADRWIPVSERLPEVDIRMGERSIRTVIRGTDDTVVGYFDGDGWDTDRGYFKIYEVLYWMPLPALPKEVEK